MDSGLQVRRFRDLEELRTQTFQAPIALLELLEEAEVRGERWWVLRAHERGLGEARWLVVLPDAEEHLFFLDGDRIPGRWDAEHEVFFPDEGWPFDLSGRRASATSLEDEALELDSAERAARSLGTSKLI